MSAEQELEIDDIYFAINGGVPTSGSHINKDADSLEEVRGKIEEAIIDNFPNCVNFNIVGITYEDPTCYLFEVISKG